MATRWDKTTPNPYGLEGKQAKGYGKYFDTGQSQGTLATELQGRYRDWSQMLGVNDPRARSKGEKLYGGAVGAGFWDPNTQGDMAAFQEALAAGNAPWAEHLTPREEFPPPAEKQSTEDLATGPGLWDAGGGVPPQIFDLLKHGASGKDIQAALAQLEVYKQGQHVLGQQQAGELLSRRRDELMGEELPYGDEWLQNMMGEAGDTAARAEQAGMQRLADLGVNFQGGQGGSLAAGLTSERIGNLIGATRSARTQQEGLREGARMNRYSLGSQYDSNIANVLTGFGTQGWQNLPDPMAAQLLKDPNWMDQGSSWVDYLSAAGGMAQGAASVLNKGGG